MHNLKNRLLKYLKQEEVMEIHSTEQLKEALEQATGYLASITLMHKDEKGDIKYTHYLLTKEFPYGDMLRVHKKQKGLIELELEKDAELPEF